MKEANRSGVPQVDSLSEVAKGQRISEYLRKGDTCRPYAELPTTQAHSTQSTKPHIAESLRPPPEREWQGDEGRTRSEWELLPWAHILK